MPSPRSSILVLSVLTLLLWCAPAHAERRTALVIGNGAYKTAPLKNPTNDAQDMADALRGMGFDVTLKLNATHREMEEAVRAFGVKLKQGGLGLFYYAGHGVQVAGENFLIPVDTKVDAEADVKFGALNAGMTLARMEDAGNDMNIVILDACRTNPFARSFRTTEQGLARMDAPKGSLIAYATAPGRVAADSGGTGRNGVYTGFLLRHMRTPGLKVEEALKRVRADVVLATKDKQVPWESSSLIGDFYFLPSKDQTTKLPAPTATEIIYQAGTGTVPDEQFDENQFKDKLHAAAEKISNEYALGQARAAYTRKDYPVAAKTLRPLAEQGNADAQAMLGMLYDQGHGVTLNYVEAAKWYSKAAEQGIAQAQFLLGVLYDNGHGVGQDYAQAFKWYRKAAEQGLAEAQSCLGWMYNHGQGVAQNYVESAKWYGKAADQNHAEAQFNLGLMYTLGQGVRQNSQEAVDYFRKAADQGYAKAQFALGMAFVLGKGVPKNYDDAASWYRKAADQGYAEAQYNLGMLYEGGYGVVQSYADAVKWFRRAAEHGHLSAQKLLGIMYSEGKGVKKDNLAAYLWTSLAASSGDSNDIRLRDFVAQKLTRTQLAKAQQMAREWKPKAAQ